MSTRDNLAAFLSDAIQRFRVPGASLSVFSEGEMYEAAAGVINTDTQVSTTTDTVFQIGSVTKLMTGTMMMQLVEEGRLDIDAPVRDVLTDFAVDDEEVSARVTVRHLLNHSSGIDGDFFIDTGRGDDMVAKLVKSGQSLPQLHPLGEGFSYCNFGFAVMGRIIEVLDGVEWGTALHRRISKPLQTEYLSVRPELLLRRRAAIGHVASGPNGSLTPVRQPYLPFAMGPAGTTPTCRARDLVDFARNFLPDSASLLSDASVEAMLTPNTTAVNAGTIRSFGLGFMLFDWNGVQLFGHDGATIGQNSFLRIHDSGLVVVLLTNGGDVHGLAHEVMTTIFRELAEFTPPAPREGTDRPIDPSRYTGVYQRGLTSIRIESDGTQLSLSTGPGDDWSKGLTPSTGPFALQPIDDDTFSYRVPGAALPLTVQFMEPDSSGKYSALHAGLRHNPRVSHT